MRTGSRTSPGARTATATTMATTLPKAKTMYFQTSIPLFASKAFCMEPAPIPQTPRRPVAWKTAAPMQATTNEEKVKTTGKGHLSQHLCTLLCSHRRESVMNTPKMEQSMPIGTATSIHRPDPNNLSLSLCDLSVQATVKICTLPCVTRTVAVVTTEATRMQQISVFERLGETCWSSSIAKSVPASGELKEAAKPHEMPMQANNDCVCGAWMPHTQPTNMATEVQTWIAGPSPPRVPPEPK
mmetsp:Transcript_43983/g.99867  ORF Transcript_43983/g.99867 Transcript_43983/m.99867 type:complete len:241 (-) Transcript_43983:11-733(-)